MATKFEEAWETLMANKCPRCKGLGKYDDAEPGDIMFNTFHCQPCNGTGFKHCKHGKKMTEYCQPCGRINGKY